MVSNLAVPRKAKNRLTHCKYGDFVDVMERRSTYLNPEMAEREGFESASIRHIQRSIAGYVCRVHRR